MPSIIFSVVAFFALIISQPAISQDNPIVKRLAALTEAYNAKDAAAISEFYTENGALLPPRSRALIGRQKIAAHYAQAFANGVQSLKYQVLEINRAGEDTAIEIGETLVQFPEQKISGRSMHVWRKVNGTWFLHRDMYHVLAISR